MSEQQINDKISEQEDVIAQIEDEADKKEIEAEAVIDNEFDPKIQKLEDELKNEQALLDEATEKFAYWKDRLAEKKELVKNLSKEHSTLIKDKSKTLTTKLKEIQAEKKEKIKPIQATIKELQKELKAYKKALQS